MPYIYEDPLFYEDWGHRRQSLKKVYPPIEGSRTWDIDDAALDELKKLASVDSTEDVDTIKLLCESILEFLDGYKGEIGQYLQQVDIEQPFQRLYDKMVLTGPVMEGPGISVPAVERKINGVWTAVDTTKWFIRDYWKPAVRFHDRKDVYNFDYDYEDADYQGRVKYTAGMGSNLSALPTDLRVAIYKLAHRQFDYRGAMFPQSSLMSSREIQNVIYKYKKIDDHYY